jgi:hypothetical protein
MRKYFLEDPIHPKGGITINCEDDTDCVFCDHCTDVWWDYSNLIYMIFCEEEHDPWDRPCKFFVETEREEK